MKWLSVRLAGSMVMCGAFIIETVEDEDDVGLRDLPLLLSEMQRDVIAHVEDQSGMDWLREQLKAPRR